MAGGCCIIVWVENVYHSNLTAISETSTFFSDLELTYRMPFKRQTMSGGEGKVGNGGHNKIKMLIFDLAGK
jgi:hypothetical protein